MSGRRYDVVLSGLFESELGKLSSAHQNMVWKKLLILERDPFYPSLRTKKMRGGSGNYESSVNMSIRIIWRFKDRNIIALLDVGHHDVLNKY